MQSVPTVHLVDQDPDTIASFRQILQDAHLHLHVHSSAGELLESNPDRYPGCIILSLRAPGAAGLQFLEILRQRHIHTPVIMITNHADIAAAVMSMKLGASDFLLKPVEPPILLASVRAALDDDRARHQRLAHVQHLRSRLSAITSRERELLKSLADGKSSKTIAAELSISVRTVENHRAHLLAKTGAENTADLVRIALTAGVI